MKIAPKPLEIFSIEDLDLIDRVKAEYQSQSDHAVALQCGIDPSLVHAVRKGRKGLGPRARLKLFDRLGFAWALPALLHVFPDELRSLHHETVFLDEGHRVRELPDGARDLVQKVATAGLKVGYVATPRDRPRPKVGK